MAQATTRRILIIGSGFGGLGLAIRLRRAGLDAFTILEQSDRLGGTWRDNQYPGAACDVPSMLYCLSFEQKTDWTRKWSSGAEIHAYMEDCARRNGLLPHVRFNTAVASARFDAESGTWTVRTTAGEELVADVLVSSVGQLHRPRLPRIPGLAQFRGTAFHSARWDHGCALAGKRVGVIGNAASAVQFVPEVARTAAHLTIFQRSANWMVPRGDRAYSAREKWAFGHIPGLARLYRWYIYLMAEAWLYPVMRRREWVCSLYRRKCAEHLAAAVPDPALREVLTPDYPVGGKRILFTDDYLPALTQANVAVVTTPIERVSEAGVVTRDGAEHPLDVLIFATGFETNPFLAPMHIEGLDGRLLENDWAEGAHAYYGLTVSGYPNFFMLYGPNTNLGHNSIIFMLECQIRYILAAVRLLIAEDLRSLDLRPEIEAAFNAELQGALRDTAWAAAGDSWYKDAAGRITNNWPYSTILYWWRTRRLDRAEYRLERRRAAGVTGSATPLQAA